MARHKAEFDRDDDNGVERPREFVATLTTPDGKVLGSDIEGIFLKINGNPVRYEGTLIIPYRWSAWADPAWNEPIVLVTDDGLNLTIKARQIRCQGLETAIVFVSQPADS